MKRYFNYGLAALAIAIVLGIAYFAGGGGPITDDERMTETVATSIGDDAVEQPGIAVEEDRPITPRIKEQVERDPSATTESGSPATPEQDGGTKPASSSASNEPAPTKEAEPQAPHSSEPKQRTGGADSVNKPIMSGDSSSNADTTAKDPKKTDRYLTEPVPEGKPEPTEPQQADVDKKQSFTVTLSVNSATILDHLDQFNADKLEVLPEDGVIFPAQQVIFYEGESVFDVLLREMKAHKIHMEFEMTPLYNSNYVEGINNIYEFDCGELSGWMYRVNGWFPNYGASRYALQDGDVVEWLYTCDLGRDIGGGQTDRGEEA